MIDQPFRKILPKYAGPLIAIYQSLGLKPNHITFIGLGIGILSALLVGMKFFIAAALVWWLGRLLDGTDGIYARATDQVSELGGFYDVVCDMAAYSSMIIGFAHAFPQQQLAWLFILLGYVLCITTALSLGALERKFKETKKDDNRTFRLSSGLAEAGETGIAYSLFLVFPEQLTWMVWVWITILFVTIASRLKIAASVTSAENQVI